MRDKKITAIIAVVTVVVICVIVALAWYNAPAQKIPRLLDLGQRYLEAEQYEQAIEIYNEIFSVDPKNESAYLGAAEAYVAMGETKKAVELLDLGYKNTRSMIIQEYMSKIIGNAENASTNAVAEVDMEYAQTTRETEDNPDEIAQQLYEYYHYGKYSKPTGENEMYGEYLTYNQYKEIYTPIINLYEKYIVLEEDYPDKYPGRAYDGLYRKEDGEVIFIGDPIREIVEAYILMGEMDKADETLEKYEKDYSTESFDKYGRGILTERQGEERIDSKTYNATYKTVVSYDDRVKSVESETNYEGNSIANVVGYDEFFYENGRIVKEIYTTNWNNGNTDIFVREFDYMDDGTVIVKDNSGGNSRWRIDKWGLKITEE